MKVRGLHVVVAAIAIGGAFAAGRVTGGSGEGAGSGASAGLGSGEARRVVVMETAIEDAERAEQARVARALDEGERARVREAAIEDAVLAREALKGSEGHVDDDPVMRARLAEQMRMRIAAGLPAVPLRAEEVDAEAARLAVGAAPRTRLAVWFVSKDRANAAKDAEALAADPAGVKGDRPPIPDGALWTEAELARAAGASVARAVSETAMGKRTPPLASAWGFYVFSVMERVAPSAAEMRERAVLSLRTAKQEDALAQEIRRIRAGYDVEVRPAPASYSQGDRR